jgi:hypothetical protein
MAPPEVVSTVPFPPPAFVERPLLFSISMVVATMREDEPKTQTRRVVTQLRRFGPVTKFQRSDTPGYEWAFRDHAKRWHEIDHRQLIQSSPYDAGGDRLWARETYFAFGRWETRYSAKKGRDEWHFVDMTVECGKTCLYAADAPRPQPLGGKRDGGVTPKWWKRPAIFMPRAASRIDLKVTGLRVEQLQRISESDCYAEGIDTEGIAYNEGENYVNAGSPIPVARWAYNTLWEEINGKGPHHWSANPWVWWSSSGGSGHERAIPLRWGHCG